MDTNKIDKPSKLMTAGQCLGYLNGLNDMAIVWQAMEKVNHYGKYYLDKIEASLFSLNLEVPTSFIPLTESVSFTKEYISGDVWKITTI